MLLARSANTWVVLVSTQLSSSHLREKKECMSGKKYPPLSLDQHMSLRNYLMNMVRLGSTVFVLFAVTPL